MHAEWQRLLEESGANFADGQVGDFGDPPAEREAALQGDVIADLSPLAVLEVGGADAQSFLAGQLSSDIARLDPARSQLSAWCTPQGRVLALFRVVRCDNAFHLLFPAELKEETAGRLKRYVLRSRVEIVDRGETLIRMGLSGAAVPALLCASLAVPPEVSDAVVHASACSIVRLAGSRPRFLLLGPYDAVGPLWRRAAQTMRAVGAPAWELPAIAACEPQVVTGTRDRFLPQILNLDLLGGVSFDKGCYPGQEVIARMKYRGHLKQRLFRGRADGSAPIPPGTRLFVPGEEAAVGEVIRSATAADGNQAILAVLRMDLAARNDIHTAGPGGVACRFTPQDYPPD